MHSIPSRFDAAVRKDSLQSDDLGGVSMYRRALLALAGCVFFTAAQAELEMVNIFLPPYDYCETNVYSGEEVLQDQSHRCQRSRRPPGASPTSV